MAIIATELTIDASGAARGHAQYVHAMDAAKAAMEKAIAANARLIATQNNQNSMRADADKI